nr:MAG TPA: Synaptonemal complex protein 1 (SCP-1) [Caudoviricetes sp.]
MAAYDGDIKLKVSLTTQDCKKSLSDLQSTITSVFSKTSASSLDKNLLSVNKTLKETQKEFEKVQSEITKTEDKMRELQTRQSVVLEKGTQSATRNTTKEYDGKFFNDRDYASIKLLDTQLENTGVRLDELNSKSSVLQNKLSSMQTNPQMTLEMKRTADAASTAGKNTINLNDNLKMSENQGRKSTNVLANGFNNVTSSMTKLSSRLLRMAKRVFFFSVITKGLRTLKSILTSLTKTDKDFSNSLKQIQTNLWIAFSVIYTKVMPALNVFMNGLAKATSYIAAFFSALSGKTIKQSYDKANELYQSANADKLKEQQKDQIDKQIDAIQDKIDALEDENKAIEKNEQKQKEANKKTLLSFDELNQINTPDTENEQIAANDKIIDQLNSQLKALQAQKKALEDEISAADKLRETLTFPTMADTISEKIIKILHDLRIVIEGSMLIIGVILLFTGNVALGLGVIIVALLMMNYTMQSFEWSDQGVANIVSTLWATLIAAELVLGAILIFSGANIPLGIGIIVAALVQSYVLYEVSWDTVSQNVKNIISELGIATGVVLIAMGIVMICTGAHIPAGIFLLLTGLGIEVAAVTINWDEITSNVSTVLEAIAALVGGAMIAIGVILICTGTGAGIVAGIAMIISGLALEASVIINWDEVPDNVKNVISTIAEIVSTAMIVIGVILICTGSGIIPGIALVIAGLALEAGMTIVNWNEVPDNVTNIIKTLTDLIGKALVVIGVILICTGAGIIPGIALVVAGLAIEATAVIDWKEVPDNVKKSISTISAILGMFLFEIGITLMFTGQIGIGLAVALAGAAGLYMAIAASPETLRETVQNEIAFYMKIIGGALLVVGAILCFTGVAIPTGLALMAAGALSLIGGFVTSNIDTTAVSSIMDESMNNMNRTISDGVKQSKETLNELNGYEVTATANLNQNITQTVATQYTSNSVPHLASGAVIPPNKEFMAVLGDQKSGTNIEAPLDTIKQAVAEVMGQGGGSSNGDININFNGNLAQLARVLKPEITREKTRAGSSLIIGGNKL